VHGANRLASNSLLEGLVFAHRIADDIAARLARGELSTTRPAEAVGKAALVPQVRRTEVQRAMTIGAGAVRSAAGLAQCAKTLQVVADSADDAQPGPLSWETSNLLHVGQLLTHVAAMREETRGGHVRSDFPSRDDAHWRGHITARREPDGSVSTFFHPVEPQDMA
jgi:L-aspartate oxidase